jgi:hypothetical protein
MANNSRAAPSRSPTLASVTSKPTVSTKMNRLRPLKRLPPSKLRRPFFRRFDGLTIDAGGTWGGLMPSRYPHFFPQKAVLLSPQASFLPRSIGILDGLPCGNLMR